MFGKIENAGLWESYMRKGVEWIIVRDSKQEARFVILADGKSKPDADTAENILKMIEK